MPGRADLGSPAIGGSFTMIGQDGRVVTNADLAGRPYLVFFGYTPCPNFCPMGLFDISAVFQGAGTGQKGRRAFRHRRSRARHAGYFEVLILKTAIPALSG